MSITLYELAGAETDRRFSPYCWRIRLALRHKGLPFETIPWHFTEKAAIAFAGTDKVPVLVDGDKTVHDSPEIAAYLEQQYPSRPSLFGGQAAQALSRFIVDWTDLVLTPGLFRLLALDIAHHLVPDDLDYYRQSRSLRVGSSLEEFCADQPKHLASFRAALAPLRRTVGKQPFLAGDQPAWADYVVFSSFQWARCISPLPLLEADDPIVPWRARMLALYDREAGNAKGYDV